MDLPPTGRLLAVDVGEKRIGLAVSDTEQRVALPLATLTRRTGRRFPMGKLRRILEEHRPIGIIIGLPLSEDGTEGAQASSARETGRLIAAKSGLPVLYCDERMSTARALRAVRDMGGRVRENKEMVDQLAATTLLQSYLDSRSQ